jgi:hypothetical protein
MDVFNHLANRLADGSPPISFEIAEGVLRVPRADENGFDVSLRKEEGFCEVYFDAWHEVFEDEEEAVRCFLFGLSKECRLRVESRGGADCTWTVEHKRGDDWISDSTTGLLFSRFWRRKQVRYLQNRRL